MARNRIAALVACAATVASCAKEPVTPAPLAGVSLTVVSGDAQSGPVNQELPQPLVVQVTGHNGRGIRGQLVNFKVTAGGGRMYAGSSLTDQDGFARDYWTLGPARGAQQVDVVAVDPTTGEKQNFGSFTATGLVPAALSISPASANFGTWPVGGTSGPTVFTVQNVGDEQSGAVTFGVGGTHASDFSVTGTTCGTLVGGQTCTASVVFSPTASGGRVGSLTASASPGGSATAALSGTGATAPALTINPASFSFGTVPVGGSSGSQTFTVINTGGSAASSVAVTIGGANNLDFYIVGTNCNGVTLTPGQSCNGALAFAPTAVGSRGAALTLTAAGGVVNSALLSGTGFAPPTLAIAPTSFNYGSIAVGSTSAPQTFTVTNVGSGPTGTVVMSITGTNGGDFLGGVNNCSGVSLASGQSCTVAVGFVPLAVGPRTATLTAVASPGSPATATLSGTGVAATAQLVMAPSSHSFGTVLIGGTPATQQFTVTNMGGSPSGSLAALVGGTNASEFSLSTDTCTGNVLVPGGACTLNVTFNPTVQGVLSATLSVSASPGGTASSSLTGTGVAPAQLSVSPLSLTFGSVALRSTSAPQVVTITNIGSTFAGPIQYTLSGPAPGEFQVSSTCAGGLAPGAVCTMSVVFAPLSTGSRTATLTVTAPAFSATVSLSGTGI